MDHSGSKSTFLQKSIKQRKLGLLKQQQQSSQQPSAQLSSNPRKKTEFNDDIEYLQQLTQELLFGTIETSETKRFTERNLPPLTSSNDLDVRLYALFALLLHNFVYEWYTKSLKLGSRDEFTKELVFLFAHISRNLQERINSADDEFIRLIVTDIPYLLEKHFESIQEVECMLARDGYEDTNEYSTNEIFVNEWMMRFSDGLVDDENIATYRRLLVKSVVCLILPHENIESSISREFVTSLLDGIVLKNVVESFCDSFVIWDIIGKICVKMSSQPKKEIEISATRRKSSIHRILEFFVIDEKFEVRTENMLEFADFIPLFSFVNFLTLFDFRFPILFTFLQVVLQLMMKVGYFKRFISSSIKRVVCEKALKFKNAEKLIDLLRHMMFPEDDRCQMKPRYIPQNENELKAIYDFNFAEVVKFLSSDSNLSRILISKYEAQNPTAVKAKAKDTMQMFKHRQINQILIQKLIDLTIARIFPELQVRDTVSMFRIHQ